jgi:acyl-CoA synthetase (AMP-forming)/AMP-acid ligase II
LRALCREHLAPYEVPSRFEFIEQIPRNVLGKALKKVLREQLNKPVPPPPQQPEPDRPQMEAA